MASAKGVSAARYARCQAVKRVEKDVLEYKETKQWKGRGKMTRMRQILLSNTEQMMGVFSSSDVKAQRVTQEKDEEI